MIPTLLIIKRTLVHSIYQDQGKNYTACNICLHCTLTTLCALFSFWHPLSSTPRKTVILSSPLDSIFFLQEQNPTQIYTLLKRPKLQYFVDRSTDQCLPPKLMIFPTRLSSTLRKEVSLCYKSNCASLNN